MLIEYCIAYLIKAKKAAGIRRIVLELYPGQTLLKAVSLGILDRVIGEKELILLREFYSDELKQG